MKKTESGISGDMWTTALASGEGKGRMWKRKSKALQMKRWRRKSTKRRYWASDIGEAKAQAGQLVSTLT